MTAAPATQPARIANWLESELDKKLTSLPDDGSRYRLLIQQRCVWERFFHSFAECGHQPFGGPHPEYGEMDAFDFSLVMASIQVRIGRLEKVAA